MATVMLQVRCARPFGCAPEAAEVAAAAHVRDAEDEAAVQQCQPVAREVHVVADLVRACSAQRDPGGYDRKTENVTSASRFGGLQRLEASEREGTASWAASDAMSPNQRASSRRRRYGRDLARIADGKNDKSCTIGVQQEGIGAVLLHQVLAVHQADRHFGAVRRRRPQPLRHIVVPVAPAAQLVTTRAGVR